MEIRRINRSEIDLVADLFDKYRVFYKQQTDTERAKIFLQERLDNNESVIFVALLNENDKMIPLAFTQLYPVYSSVRTIKNWILNDLYVEAAYRKRGIGEQLIKTAMDFAKKEGAIFVQLSTATDNYIAQSLYESIGFIKQEPEKDFFTYRIALV